MAVSASKVGVFTSALLVMALGATGARRKQASGWGQHGTSSLTALQSNLHSTAATTTRYETSCTWENSTNHFDLSYGPETCSPGSGKGCNQMFDLLTTTAAFGEGAAPVPLAVYVHGGSWRAGDKEKGLNQPEFAALRQRGMHFASINYRLTPEVTFPTHAQDVGLAIAYFKSAQFTQEYNVDPNRVFLIGSSAGGQLVSLVGTTQRLGSRARPAVVVNFYGPVALYLTNDEAKIQDMLGCDTPATEGTACHETAKLASPTEHVSSQSPPFLSFYGTKDRSFPTAHLLQEAGVEAGADYTLKEVDCASDAGCHNLEAMFDSKTDGVCNVDVMYTWLYENLNWHPTGCGPSPGNCPSATA